MELNKEIVIKALQKMLDDKKTIQSYLRGEITLEDVEAKGIKFAKPI